TSKSIQAFQLLPNSGQTLISSPVSFTAGDLITAEYRSANSRWYVGQAGGRIVQTGNTNYYVSNAGSDTTGTGTIGSPWATMQHFWDFIINKVDLGGFYAICN